MEVKLIVKKAPASLREVTLRRPRTVVGRKKGCKLRIESGGVSRIHCVLLRQDDGLIVKDLTSTNGTFVNGQRISVSELKPGDVLGVGSLEFVVQIDGVPPVTDEPSELVGGEAFFESDETETADGSPVLEDAELFVMPLDGNTKLDLKSLSASLHPTKPDDASNFVVDERGAEPTAFSVAPPVERPPHERHPKPG